MVKNKYTLFYKYLNIYKTYKMFKPIRLKKHPEGWKEFSVTKMNIRSWNKHERIQECNYK